ncbi:MULTISPECIES: hypothetical protein, partial [unclassified Pseudomonas]|uniref:hypothetical protein n=1 Tax=unclassified Pseudomonas TaxID=196821 RepID=UPI001C44A6EB
EKVVIAHGKTKRNSSADLPGNVSLSTAQLAACQAQFGGIARRRLAYHSFMLRRLRRIFMGISDVNGKDQTAAQQQCAKCFFHGDSVHGGRRVNVHLG